MSGESYFWVRRARDLEWIIAEWLPALNKWYECGNDESISVSEIGPRIPDYDEGLRFMEGSQ